MTPDGTYQTYRRACAVSDLRWREWCEILHSGDTGEALRIASKRYKAADSVVKHAGREWRMSEARAAAKAWCAPPYGIGAPVKRIAG